MKYFTVQVTRTYTMTDYAQVEIGAASEEEAKEIALGRAEDPNAGFWMGWEALDQRDPVAIFYDVEDIEEQPNPVEHRQADPWPTADQLKLALVA